MSERPRREKISKLSALEALKRAREGGGRSYKVEEDATLYDEVTEEEYKSIVRGRLAKDDFVVDDGVEGYMDNGMDDFEEHGDYYMSDEDDKKPKAKKAAIKPKAKAKPKPPPPAVTHSISAYRPTVSKEQEEVLMASILGNMDHIVPTSSTSRSRKRKPEPEPEAIPSSKPRTVTYGYRSVTEADSSSDGVLDTGMPSGPSSDDDFALLLSPKKKFKKEPVGMAPAIDRLAQLKTEPDSADEFFGNDSFQDMDMDAFMDIDDVDVGTPSKAAKKEDVKRPLAPLNVNGASHAGEKKKALDATPAWLSVYDSLSVTRDDAFSLTGSSSASKDHANAPVLEEDGSLHFYWLDYFESDGKVYFIGKTQDKRTNAWLSCCVTIENLQRNLFVLPREYRVEEDEETGEMVDTDVVPSIADVYTDFDKVRKKVGIKSWKAKPVKRQYAFSERDVPREETQWLKVVYGFDEPQIPNNVSSPNFIRVFGTNTSAFELLVLKRKIMGPCWLQVKKPVLEKKGISWCTVEATVADPKDINPFAESESNAPKDVPPLTVMSLSVRTIVNHQENNREVVCATARTWPNMQLDDPTPPERLPCSVHTYVRPLDRFPPNFEARARANGKGFISPVKDERTLLNQLLLTIYKADPDVIVGHEFLGVSLDVLLRRMRDLKADKWSRIGRFRRNRWPNIGRQGTNLKFVNGRLLCDLASDGAKGMITSTTWSLTEMCRTHLKLERQDIDPDDTASYFDGSVRSPERLLTFVRHCELDAHYQMALAAKVQILPLTRQLTNLAGNSWNKTLNGGRAERNEYILLHEFHRLKYIVPDKQWGKRAEAAVKEHDDDNEGTGGKKTKGRKDKYKGGLVFEPKRGLWDKYILVMDFNSLYPSIIQEYNIDFTTVDRVEDDEDGNERIPDPPSSEIPQGVLPRLIATLVSRRRQVKSLMKDRRATPAQLLQWDIKQMALKLTANSMYGCLGFEYSRFYARPLAALTTFKGREILTNTRELAESLQLDVVYGDTDSVFVNSNVTELSEALKISAEFKKAVNDRYKLLEIDLDGVFQRLLLLQKKKYAAIKVEDGTRTSTEVKGLDMKRREYCALSKAVSQYVLEQILSGESTETVVEHIHEYLTTVGQDRLGKNPEDYPDAKSQPHVQVALKMKAKGGTARAGDVIPYVFCLGDNGEGSRTAQADHAKHPEEFAIACSLTATCIKDYEFYLSQQVLPPIERLCEPIEGTDRARLAECLGLDPNRYRTAAAGEAEGRYFSSLDSLMSDAERFKDCDPFLVRCRSCKERVAFSPIGQRDTSLLLPSGPACSSCHATLGTPSVQVQLEVQIRAHISRYYEGWTVCDDATCGARTRMMGVYGRRCLRPGCLGHVSFEVRKTTWYMIFKKLMFDTLVLFCQYSDAMLYDQLRYYAYLFDGEKAMKGAAGPKAFDEIKALVHVQADFLRTMSQTVEKYLELCGRRWVELGTLFSFMKI
ncbi:hypothetical protein NM688_g5461 [Phlebia brevispora]|uniref:Uncharacterized protein n=1 Tax=Phlebia brevispora TaxID=194682 RepID=A0ACC1SUS4_9APHY|nr:hypothetical protein NM688_g5461 [Phlebia brevispora]